MLGTSTLFAPIVARTRSLACVLVTLLFEIKSAIPQYDITKYFPSENAVINLITSTTTGDLDTMFQKSNDSKIQCKHDVTNKVTRCIIKIVSFYNIQDKIL